MLKITAEYDDKYCVGKICFLVKFLPASLIGVFAGIFQRALVDKSGMIRTQMEDFVDQKCL
jgi:hypothetical protein